MGKETRCPVCGEMTETDYRQQVNNYVVHVCVKCGADKKQDGQAPV